MTLSRWLDGGQLGGEHASGAGEGVFADHDVDPYPTAVGVHISHHGEYVPKRWLPPLIGTAVIESEAKRQYKEFLAEIDRRRAAASSRRDQGP